MADGQESNCNAGDLKVQSLGLQDHLEEEMATHSSGKSYYTEDLLPDKYHGQRSLVGPRTRGHKESAIIEQLTL